MNNFIGLVCFLSCVHISDSSHYIEHYIHYYIIIVRLCAATFSLKATWLHKSAVYSESWSALEWLACCLIWEKPELQRGLQGGVAVL